MLISDFCRYKIRKITYLLENILFSCDLYQVFSSNVQLMFLGYF